MLSARSLSQYAVVALILFLWTHTLLMIHELLAKHHQDSAAASGGSAPATPKKRHRLREFSPGTRAAALMEQAEHLMRMGGHGLSVRAEVYDDDDDRNHSSSNNNKEGEEETPEQLAAARASSSSSSSPEEEEQPLDDSYFVVFSTGCSEFQDWQSIGVFSSAEAVGQRGVVLRIASGCTAQQEAAIRHAMAHLPRRCRVHFAPNTKVTDHRGAVYKYANKPLGMLHWLTHAEEPVPPSATVALVDPDMFFLRPLWHDSFDTAAKYITTFANPRQQRMMSPMPSPRLTRGTMVAQRYGIGGAPWFIEDDEKMTRGGGEEAKRQHRRRRLAASSRNSTDHDDEGKAGKPKKNEKKEEPLPWGLEGYFTAIGRPHSPALAADLFDGGKRAGMLGNGAASYYSIGAPYIALASDWLPIASNWTGLMPMAVRRNFGNLAEMYAMVIAVADYGIRPVTIDNLMVSDVHAPGEGWPWVDELPLDRGCDPAILTDPNYNLPTFLHYCQRYEIEELKPTAGSEEGKAEARGTGGAKTGGNNGNRVDGERGAYWMYTKYQVPDEILACPAGKTAVEGGISEEENPKKKQPTRKQQPKKSKSNMKLVGAEQLLPEPQQDLRAAARKPNLRNIFAHCAATRATNQAAKDYRRWFCR